MKKEIAEKASYHLTALAFKKESYITIKKELEKDKKDIQAMKQNKFKEKINDCPRCGSEAVNDFEGHEIYCTGCPLRVRDIYKNINELIKIWNNIYKDIICR